eukprot:s364_g24.t1
MAARPEPLEPEPFAPPPRSGSAMGCSGSRSDLVKPQDLLTEASEVRTEETSPLKPLAQPAAASAAEPALPGEAEPIIELVTEAATMETVAKEDHEDPMAQAASEPLEEVAAVAKEDHADPTAQAASEPLEEVEAEPEVKEVKCEEPELSWFDSATAGDLKNLSLHVTLATNSGSAASLLDSTFGEERSTALHLSAQQGHVEVCRWLLAARAEAQAITRKMRGAGPAMGVDLGMAPGHQMQKGANSKSENLASHPGPLQNDMDLLTIGTTNPSGLRSKEPLAVEQGCGIWSYAETQLSKVTQRTTAKALKWAARQKDRHLRVHYGAPAALRARSSWAGTWTGVAVTSDFPSRILQVDWPAEIWEWPGPTWPRAAALTNDILDYITRQFVIGYQGIVVISGDFNFSPQEPPSFATWQAYGYMSAQELAYQRWSQPKSPTCKGATERDMLWLSPQASAICQAVAVDEIFQDHASVSVRLNIEHLRSSISTWPRPRELPWNNIHLEEWHQSCQSIDIPHPSDSTQALTELAKSYEDSLTGFISDFPSAKLTNAHCGRAQRLQPAKVPPSQRLCRASRQGEARLVADNVGNAVLVWFKQLRRLQSYRHAACAGNQHPAAVQYRIELWSSIRRARGFEHSFADWWLRQDFVTALGPLPTQPPDASTAILIYQAFHHVFRDFEHWHLQQRQQVLQAKYDKTMKGLFQDLRKARPDQVESFWATTSYEIKAIKPTTCSVLLHQAAPAGVDGHWFLHGKQLAVEGSVEELLVFSSMPDIAIGDCIEFHTHTSTASQVHQQLAAFWKPKWSCDMTQQEETWHRMTHFVKDYMPKLPLTLPPLTVAMWDQALKRLKPQAAREADGWARLDLIHMPLAHKTRLLTLLTAIEENKVPWPRQLLEGLVIAISKGSYGNGKGLV